MRVQYLDPTDFEGFVVEDPNNNYAPLFRVYPHNAVPPITTHVPVPNLHIPLTMRASGPAIREVDNSSDDGRALDNLVEHAKNEWIYLGRRTPEQLDAENKVYSFILGLAGINTSVVSDIAGKIANISDLIPGWHEPKFYDVYEIIPTNPITTTIRVLVPVQGKPFSRDNSLESVDVRIISLLANSHPEVQRVLSDQLMEEGSTPFGRVPASFNYSRSDIETLDSILKPFEAMKNMPFVEGKNVLFFYQPTYGREKKDTKEFLESNEVIKMLDLAYDIMPELMGYRPYGNQKRLFIHSFDFSPPSGGQPVINWVTNENFSHPIFMMSHDSIPKIMYSFLTPGGFDNFSTPYYLLTLDSMDQLIYFLTIGEILNTHRAEFSPQMRKSLDRWYAKMIDDFALAFKYVSEPKADNMFTGVSIIRKVGENRGEDFYKNFFRIWNNIIPYINANPGVANDQYPYTNFFRSDGDGKRIDDSKSVRNTLIISAFSAAAGKDLQQQFSDYRVIGIHQGLFDKTYPFFRDVLDYSQTSQK